MPNTDRLVVSAMALRGAATEEWASFTIALREYAAAQVAEMLKCAPEMLPKAQGMALAMQELSQMMNEAPALYDKLAQRSANGRRPDASAIHRSAPAATFRG